MQRTELPKPLVGEVKTRPVRVSRIEGMRIEPDSSPDYWKRLLAGLSLSADVIEVRLMGIDEAIAKWMRENGFRIELRWEDDGQSREWLVWSSPDLWQAAAESSRPPGTTPASLGRKLSPPTTSR
jgi:hypothetical protein